MKEFISNLKKKVVIGIVGGSDYDKIQEQMGGVDSKKLATAIAIAIAAIHTAICICELIFVTSYIHSQGDV